MSHVNCHNEKATSSSSTWKEETDYLCGVCETSVQTLLNDIPENAT